MPTVGEKVKIISASEDQFQTASSAQELDDNTIYFVLGSAYNSIWVGDKLYATGILPEELSNWIQIEHHTAIIEYSDNTTPEYVIEDWDDTLYNTVFIGGIYINGLRSVDEFYIDDIVYDVTGAGDNSNASENEESEITMYTPVVIYGTEISYTTPIELVIDCYRIKFKEPMGGESDDDSGDLPK